MKLLEQVDLVGRRMRLSANTIAAYSSWIQQYLRFCSARLGRWEHPEKLGTSDCEAFLNDLVVRRRLSASSQNQALNALVFLYSRVLENTMPQDHLGRSHGHAAGESSAAPVRAGGRGRAALAKRRRAGRRVCAGAGCAAA